MFLQEEQSWSFGIRRANTAMVASQWVPTRLSFGWSMHLPERERLLTESSRPSKMLVHDLCRMPRIPVDRGQPSIATQTRRPRSGCTPLPSSVSHRYCEFQDLHSAAIRCGLMIVNTRSTSHTGGSYCGSICLKWCAEHLAKLCALVQSVETVTRYASVPTWSPCHSLHDGVKIKTEGVL